MQYYSNCFKSPWTVIWKWSRTYRKETETCRGEIFFLPICTPSPWREWSYFLLWKLILKLVQQQFLFCSLLGYDQQLNIHPVSCSLPFPTRWGKKVEGKRKKRRLMDCEDSLKGKANATCAIKPKRTWSLLPAISWKAGLQHTYRLLGKTKTVTTLFILSLRFTAEHNIIWYGVSFGKFRSDILAVFQLVRHTVTGQKGVSHPFKKR